MFKTLETENEAKKDEVICPTYSQLGTKLRAEFYII